MRLEKIREEICKVCHKTKADAIILDNNPLSIAEYLEMNDKWEKEGICIVCQLDNLKPKSEKEVDSKICMGGISQSSTSSPAVSNKHSSESSRKGRVGRDCETLERHTESSFDMNGLEYVSRKRQLSSENLGLEKRFLRVYAILPKFEKVYPICPDTTIDDKVWSWAEVKVFVEEKLVGWEKLLQTLARLDII